MKTKNAKPGIIAGFIFFACLAITAIAWQDSTTLKAPKQQSRNDTLPDKVHIDIDLKDLDKAMKDLDVQMGKLSTELKDINWSKISEEINASLKKIDLNKIQLEI